jgi:prolyl oligopeptidase
MKHALPGLLAAAALSAFAAAPVAEVQEVTTTHHGTPVADPYRWLEDSRSPKALAWMKAHGDATRALLDRIEDRDAILARLAELSKASGDVVGSLVQMPGDRYWYLLRKAGENQFKLVMRQGLGGPERVVVDPAVHAMASGVPHAINHFSASWDGRHVAYGVSAGGSEYATLHVIEAATGKPVAEPAPRVLQRAQWLPDGRGLLYTQLKAPTPGEPATEYYKDAQIWLQRLDGSAPRAVFGRAATPGLGLERLDHPQPITAAGSRWVVARTTDTTLPEGRLYVTPATGIDRPVWRPLDSSGYPLQAVALKGDELFVLSRDKAPRRKVVSVDLKRGTFATARARVAEPDSGVIEWMLPTRSGLLLGHRDGTAVKPFFHTLKAAGTGTAPRAVALPAAGAAWPAGAPAADRDDVLLAFSSWAEPTRHLRVVHGGPAPHAAPVALGAPPQGLNLPPLQVTDVEFASHDGVKVPMTVLHRKGLALDGSHPVLLNGYASYGFSISAGYQTGRMAWIERGGVVALVNPRGSGVHGEDWYRAGFKQTKRNTWLDGVAAAKWLIANGYGSPKTMTVMGTSAGGIFVGRAVTTAPELFAGAIFDVGVLDAVRSEECANGITNVSEFGTVKDPAEFKALLEMSTYHQVKDGTAYPGVMLVHGLNDPRVDVWHSAKTAARLQAANSGGRPTLLRLDAQAGHGMGSTASQRDQMQADIQAFLLWQAGKLKLKD